MKPSAEHRRRKFARAFFVHGNGARAAREAGFKGEPATLAVRGSELLADPLVKQELDALHAQANARSVMDFDEAARKLADVARFDFGMILDEDRAKIDLKGADMAGALRIVEKLEITDEATGAEGNVTAPAKIVVGLPSRIQAIATLAKLFGWNAAEKLNVSRLPFSDEELEAEIARELTKTKGKGKK